MWIIIFFLVILVMLIGFFYLMSRFYRLRNTKKLQGDKKIFRIILSFLPIFLIIVICWFTIGLINAIIVILHLCVVWFIADVITIVVKKIRKKDSNYNITAIAVLVFTTVYLTFGWHLAHDVKRTSYQTKTEKINGNLRIVQISDSHIGAIFHADGFAEHIEQINKENPDVVVITGDFVDDYTSYDDMVESSKALGNLKTKYGVYFVFGNHDKGYYGDSYRNYSTAQLLQNLEENNVIVLQDEKILIDDHFYIIGRQDASERSRKSMDELFSDIGSEKYTIVLDHQPTDYNAEKNVNADMVLSGHTHGGQLIPITYIGEWTGINDSTYGLENRGNTTFITSSGIADWVIKFKTGCISEYVVIDVKGR